MRISLKEAIRRAAIKYGYPLDTHGRLSGRSGKHKPIRMSGKNGLHGEKFYAAWNKI